MTIGGVISGLAEKTPRGLNKGESFGPSTPAVKFMFDRRIFNADS